eukprot:scaffold885_cov58-Attheya_sp.AAC.2
MMPRGIGAGIDQVTLGCNVGTGIVWHCRPRLIQGGSRKHNPRFTRFDMGHINGCLKHRHLSSISIIHIAIIGPGLWTVPMELSRTRLYGCGGKGGILGQKGRRIQGLVHPIDGGFDIVPLAPHQPGTVHCKSTTDGPLNGCAFFIGGKLNDFAGSTVAMVPERQGNDIICQENTVHALDCHIGFDNVNGQKCQSNVAAHMSCSGRIGLDQTFSGPQAFTGRFLVIARFHQHIKHS